MVGTRLSKPRGPSVGLIGPIFTLLLSSPPPLPPSLDPRLDVYRIRFEENQGSREMGLIVFEQATVE